MMLFNFLNTFRLQKTFTQSKTLKICYNELNKSEKEVLFNRDAKFIVKDRYLLDGKPFIVLEEYHE